MAQTTPEEAAAYAAALPDLHGREVTGVPERINDSLSAIGVDVEGGPLDENAREMVRLLQADRPDFPTYVVGQASGLQDFTDSMFERALPAFALVALATLVLLFLMTGLGGHPGQGPAAQHRLAGGEPGHARVGLPAGATSRACWGTSRSEPWSR